MKITPLPGPNTGSTICTRRAFGVLHLKSTGSSEKIEESLYNIRIYPSPKERGVVKGGDVHMRQCTHDSLFRVMYTCVLKIMCTWPQWPMCT